MLFSRFFAVVDTFLTVVGFLDVVVVFVAVAFFTAVLMVLIRVLTGFDVTTLLIAVVTFLTVSCTLLVTLLTTLFRVVPLLLVVFVYVFFAGSLSDRPATTVYFPTVFPALALSMAVLLRL